jgi:ParB-like nuclease family protein
LPESDDVSTPRLLETPPPVSPPERLHSPRVEREGLPASYRMRADRHYVDQLVSRSADVPIRLIPIEQIDGAHSPVLVDLAPLVRSIRTHGVLEPLIVLSRETRYTVISGKNRLAAAAAAGLTEVPCVVYHGDNERAASLTEAAALRVSPTITPESSAVAGVTIHEFARQLSRDLSALYSAAKLLEQPTLVAGRLIAADLVRAQSWRMSWLVNAVSLLSRQQQPPLGRRRHVSDVVDRVVEGLEPETRLARTELTCRIDPAVSGLTIDETVGATAITAAVLLMLTTLETVDQPSLRIELLAAEGRALVIEVEQTRGAVNASQVRDLLNLTTGGLLVRVAVECLTAWYQGEAEVHGKDGKTTLRSTLHLIA